MSMYTLAQTLVLFVPKSGRASDTLENKASILMPLNARTLTAPRLFDGKYWGKYFTIESPAAKTRGMPEA
ncbi:unnamed protein product [Ixodes hexagonus]